MQQWDTQMTFEELGQSLHDITFVVVDLETTGGSASKGAMITEVGAVKVRGGEVLAEFQTLVNPQSQVPAFITGLTGITNEMVCEAPTIDGVIPAFLEFAHGCVLVAHNAPFDIGFLKHFAQDRWPSFEVIDTARLARQLVSRDEAPNCKLATLAALFDAATSPSHRALADARATVDVLHALIGRVGNQGVHTLEELKVFSSRVSPTVRRKRHLAEQLPHAPGVYLFKDASDRVLYVGTSRDLRKRVRSYFTSSEKRSRIGEMVSLAERVDAVVCASPLEASVREIRLIAAHTPPYNRRSRYPNKVHWLKITKEAWPRLSVVRSILDDDADYFGPFTKRSQADKCLEALHDTFRIRQCKDRFGRQPDRNPCILSELGRCLSPCNASTTHEEYAAEVERLRVSLRASPAPLINRVQERMSLLAKETRYEEAAIQRDRLSAFVRFSARSQRLSALTSCAELVAAHKNETGQWTVHVVRYGRLVAAGVMPTARPPQDFVNELCNSSETVIPGPGPTLMASPEESELIAGWLAQPGVRMVRARGTWVCPVDGAGRWSAEYDAMEQSRHLVAGF